MEESEVMWMGETGRGRSEGVYGGDLLDTMMTIELGNVLQVNKPMESWYLLEKRNKNGAQV